jgi:G protein-coupled receptor GPR1
LTDFATLFIAIHGALQIFRPSFANFDTGEGLYYHRRIVYCIILGIPTLLASLAFLNPVAAYTAQGAFCALPSKPIWYRLGLSWIPRYIIGLTVAGLAIAVYVHVELRFRSFAEAAKSASTASNSLPTPMQSRRDSVTQSIEKSTMPAEGLHVMPVIIEPPFEPENEEALEETTASRHNSPKDITMLGDDSTRPEDQNHFSQQASRKQSVCTTSSTINTTTSRKSMFFWKQSARLDSVVTSPRVPSPTPEAQNMHTRRVMRRQLRLIFIYPIVYIALWIPPLTLNLLQYSPKYQKSLPAALAVTSTICLTLMGGIDCVVFLWREKPWRRGARSRDALRRPGASLSYSGGGTLDEEDPPSTFGQQAQSQMEHSTSTAPLSPRSPYQAEDVASPLPSSRFPKMIPRAKLGPRRAASESQTAARERAYERLALETADRRGGSLRDSVGSRNSGSYVSEGNGTAPGAWPGNGMRTVTKEWWDRRDSDAPMPPTGRFSGSV